MTALAKVVSRKYSLPAVLVTVVKLNEAAPVTIALLIPERLSAPPVNDASRPYDGAVIRTASRPTPTMNTLGLRFSALASVYSPAATEIAYRFVGDASVIAAIAALMLANGRSGAPVATSGSAPSETKICWSYSIAATAFSCDRLIASVDAVPFARFVICCDPMLIAPDIVPPVRASFVSAYAFVAPSCAASGSSMFVTR